MKQKKMLNQNDCKLNIINKNVSKSFQKDLEEMAQANEIRL